MSEKYTFSVIGGDHRQLVIIKKLLLLGHGVKVFSISAPIGCIPGAEFTSSAEKALEGSDILLLPLPMSRDGISINLTSTPEELGIASLFGMLSKKEKPLIFGGLIPREARALTENAALELIDYYECEELQIKNALPSAEGAIMVAMENTDRVIEGMEVLVCGYGRIGKILAHKLKLLGAHVSVAARRDEVLCEIAMGGFDPIDIKRPDELTQASINSDVIFNTIPVQIFSKQIINKIDTDPLYIEIASAPGGIDVQSARAHGLRLIFAPSLPGKYAPSSAGEYIFETIKDILDKRGMNI